MKILDQPCRDGAAQGVDLNIAEVAGIRGELLGELPGAQIHPDADDHGAGAVAVVTKQLSQDACGFFTVRIDIVDPFDRGATITQRADGFTNRYSGGTGDLLHTCRRSGQGEGEGHIQPRVLG